MMALSWPPSGVYQQEWTNRDRIVELYPVTLVLRIKNIPYWPLGLFRTVFVRCNGRRTELNKGKVKMLFYTAIFVVCVIAAISIPWLYRLISSAGKAVQQTIFPGSEKGPTSHLKTTPVYSGNNGASAPWDLTSYNEPMVLARVSANQAEVDQAMGENTSYYGPNNVYAAPLRAKVILPSSGWIQREDKRLHDGITYKVTRRVKTREKNPKYVSRPSSW